MAKWTTSLEYVVAFLAGITTKTVNNTMMRRPPTADILPMHIPKIRAKRISLLFIGR